MTLEGIGFNFWTIHPLSVVYQLIVVLLCCRWVRSSFCHLHHTHQISSLQPLVDCSVKDVLEPLLVLGHLRLRNWEFHFVFDYLVHVPSLPDLSVVCISLIGSCLFMSKGNGMGGINIYQTLNKECWILEYYKYLCKRLTKGIGWWNRMIKNWKNWG